MVKRVRLEPPLSVLARQCGSQRVPECEAGAESGQGLAVKGVACGLGAHSQVTWPWASSLLSTFSEHSFWSGATLPLLSAPFSSGHCSDQNDNFLECPCYSKASTSCGPSQGEVSDQEAWPCLSATAPMEENASYIIFMEPLFWTLSSFNLRHSLPAARNMAHRPSTPTWSCRLEAMPQAGGHAVVSRCQGQAPTVTLRLRFRPPPSDGIRSWQ